MADSLSPERRSWNMSRIRSRDTKPELLLRSKLHRAGLRFRVHRRNLPGNPDIVLPKYSTVIFVHGCYWHRHKGCKNATTPSTRTGFWEAKFANNIKRDEQNILALKAAGWQPLVIWECELKRDPNRVLKDIEKKLREKD
jgi:DNA mismatch endonuclease, patch repair protein